jgi:hypothetical protein
LSPIRDIAGLPLHQLIRGDEVKRVLLGAKYISFPNAEAGAAAGVSFEETIRKLGIAEAMNPKIKPDIAALALVPTSRPG